VREFNVDASQGGAFGLDSVAAEGSDFNFAVIDDVTNSLAVGRLAMRETCECGSH